MPLNTPNVSGWVVLEIFAKLNAVLANVGLTYQSAILARRLVWHIYSNHQEIYIDTKRTLILKEIGQ